MTHVLVTGGAGRLGRSVVRGLAAEGYRVTSVDVSPGGPEELGDEVAVRSADLTDPQATYALMRDVRPEAVVQLAAIAVPFSAPEDVILRTNVSIAHNVCGAAVEAGARRVVVASSPTVIGYGAPAGWLPERLPIDERTPPKPWNAYGLSKLVAEQVAAMCAASHGDRVRLSSFRPCFVIAPEEWSGAPTQQGHTVRERLDDPALAAPALFNYVDARDVTDFLALLLEGMGRVDNGETFFVGAQDALARRPLAELVPQFVPGTERLAEHLAGTEPAFDCSRAAEVLGWRARRSWREELVGDQVKPAAATAGGRS